jgi:hypothetical protein
VPHVIGYITSEDGVKTWNSRRFDKIRIDVLATHISLFPFATHHDYSEFSDHRSVPMTYAAHPDGDVAEEEPVGAPGPFAWTSHNRGYNQALHGQRLLEVLVHLITDGEDSPWGYFGGTFGNERTHILDARLKWYFHDY